MEELPPATLDEYIAQLLAVMIREKECARVSPPHVELQEFLARLRDNATETLRSMTRAKILTCHTLLNSVAFEFTPPK